MKDENAGALSLEYLQSFHDLVKAHPAVYKHVLEEVHLKARGSAGGKKRWSQMTPEEAEALIEPGDDPGKLEGLEKSTNAAFSEGDFIETDEYFDVPTVFAREGVFTGTNGIPQLKTFDALKASAPRFLGVPITPKHIETDTIRPDDRWLGHVIEAHPRDDKRDIFGISRYFKANLTEDEIGKIRSKQYPDGSIGYFTPLKNEAGEFKGDKYAAEELGNYTITEYATFFDGTKGACTREQGCGPFQNAKKKAKDEPEDRLVLDKNGNVRKCPLKQKNGDNSMTEELEKKLNSAYSEIESLKAEMEKLKNAKPPEVDLKPITDRIDGLDAKFENAAKVADAQKDAANKAEFKKNLNAAAATEIDTLWEQVKGLNPVEYDAWKFTNSTKLLTEAEKKGATGKKHANAGDAVEQARARADATLFKRR